MHTQNFSHVIFDKNENNEKKYHHITNGPGLLSISRRMNLDPKYITLHTRSLK